MCALRMAQGRAANFKKKKRGRFAILPLFPTARWRVSTSRVVMLQHLVSSVDTITKAAVNSLHCVNAMHCLQLT